MNKQEKKKINDELSRIITFVNNGVKEKRKVLLKELPRNTKTGNPYTGSNAGHLLNVRKEKEYKSNIWGTFLQWRDKKRTVTKGEQGYKIIRPVTKKLVELDDDGNEQEIPVRKFYRVFNEEQTEKLIEELGVKWRKKEQMKMWN